MSRTTARVLLAGSIALAALAAPAAASAQSTSVDYGPISHQGLRSAGPASSGLKLSLQLGLIADQQGIANAAKAASSPTSSSYGSYPSLSTLASKYGASSSRRNAVVGAFKPYGVTATVDVTHLRVSATMSIKNAEKLFGTQWNLYASGGPGNYVALPVSTPKLGSGLKGNVDTVAGLRLTVSSGSASAAGRGPVPARSAQAAGPGGTPTRTGTIDAGCTPSAFPAAVRSSAGLFPNQILTAYGIAPLHASGLQGQGSRVAILGEAPTPANDVNTYRNCFGFAGTPLSIHGASSIQPILESSLDAMTVAMVAPQLAHFDLWVHPIAEESDDGDVLGFLALLQQPLQATTSGAALPDVVSISYGVCEPTVAPYTASRTLVDRQLAAMAALGITTVVAAGDTGSSSCAHGVPAGQVTSAEQKPAVSSPASSPWVLAVGGTNLTLTDQNAIASTGVWNDTAYPQPYTKAAGGGGGVSTVIQRPWWQPATSTQKTYRMVPDVAAFADESPGYAIVCSPGVQGCGPSSGQTISFVGGTSASAPLVAGMIALWDQQARQAGAPRPGFVPPLLYALAQRAPASFLDVRTGGNAVFGGVACCTAGPGFDLASGLGSPLADQIAGQLHR
jgi:subtilase family serine protease